MYSEDKTLHTILNAHLLFFSPQACRSHLWPQNQSWPSPRGQGRLPQPTEETASHFRLLARRGRSNQSWPPNPASPSSPLLSNPNGSPQTASFKHLQQKPHASAAFLTPKMEYSKRTKSQIGITLFPFACVARNTACATCRQTEGFPLHLEELRTTEETKRTMLSAKI